MIKNKTVFVLGAGASVHLGFPTTGELRKRIVHCTRPNHNDDWGRLGIEQGHQHEFHRSFQTSGLISIDSFLELRPEFDRIGKMAIAKSLIEFENEAVLWKHTEIRLEEPSSNWYEYFFTLLRTGAKSFAEFEQNDFDVVTFNYDRSLQHYLAKSIEASYKVDYIKAAEFLNGKIRHVHGSLGVLGSNEGQRSYAPHSDAGTVARAAETIRVIHEREDAKLRSEVSTLLTGAKRLLFLGFGYDRTNMARIGMDQLKHQAAWGTCYGLQPGEIGAVNSRYKIQFEVSQSATIEPLLRNRMSSILHD